MATWPAKTNYATGDVLTAAEMQDIGNALNSVGSAQYAAGKNKIINGDFAINQRQFTSTTSSGTFGFDRFRISAVDGTVTYSAQTFTLGAAPVAGYESANFARIVTSGQTLATARADLNTPIESVRTLAGQTVTVSFWAKAASGTPKVAIEVGQNFGTGGSPSAYNPKYFGQVTLGTTWARYSVTATLDSISGKTIGTNNVDSLNVLLFVSAGSNLDARTGSLGIQTNTFDFWGVQAEPGSSATPFQTATGTLAGELAACQRYYWRTTTTNVQKNIGTIAYANSSTIAILNFTNPVAMRVPPTSVDFSNLIFQNYANTQYALSAITLDPVTETVTSVYGTISGATAGHVGRVLTASSGTAFIGFNAEL